MNLSYVRQKVFCIVPLLSAPFPINHLAADPIRTPVKSHQCGGSKRKPNSRAAGFYIKHYRCRYGLPNGSGGETFSAPAGTYYLEYRNVPPTYNFRSLRSDNPQTLEIGGTITFNIQYFKTEEQKGSGRCQAFAMVTPVKTGNVVRAHPCASPCCYSRPRTGCSARPRPVCPSSCPV